MPLTNEPANVHLSTRAVAYLKRHILRGDDPSIPGAFKRFPAIVYCLGTMWIDPDGIFRERGPEYLLAEFDISLWPRGFLLRFDTNRFVAFAPEESEQNKDEYFIDVVKDEIFVRIV